MNPRCGSILPALLAALALAGCAPDPGPTPEATLITGEHPGPIPTASLRAATATAQRFGQAYAASIYSPDPPVLPDTTATVDAQIRTAAARVPPARRPLDPHAGAIDLEPTSPDRIEAALTVIDGRSPPFSVGFRLERRHGRWLVTAISTPG